MLKSSVSANGLLVNLTKLKQRCTVKRFISVRSGAPHSRLVPRRKQGVTRFHRSL